MDRKAEWYTKERKSNDKESRKDLLLYLSSHVKLLTASHKAPHHQHSSRHDSPAYVANSICILIGRSPRAYYALDAIPTSHPHRLVSKSSLEPLNFISLTAASPKMMLKHPSAAVAATAAEAEHAY